MEGVIVLCAQAHLRQGDEVSHPPDEELAK